MPRVSYSAETEKSSTWAYINYSGVFVGKAVITTKGASCEDYTQNHRNALLVAPGDIAGYRAAIQEVCENAQLRQTIEHQARQDAEQRFTYRHFAKEVIALCEKLLFA